MNTPLPNAVLRRTSLGAVFVTAALTPLFPFDAKAEELGAKAVAPTIAVPAIHSNTIAYTPIPDAPLPASPWVVDCRIVDCGGPIVIITTLKPPKPKFPWGPGCAAEARCAPPDVALKAALESVKKLYREQR